MDVSCFLLVEDSGDSEQCLEMDMGGGIGNMDEDDAESCSCETISDEIRLLDLYDDEVVGDSEGTGWSCEMLCMDIEEDLGYASAEEEEQGLDIGLCREVMDRMEDRVFWETCMAVGYP